MLGPHGSQRARAVGAVGPNHHHVGMVDQALNAVAEQRRHVWNLLLDVLAVGTLEARHHHVRVVDAHVAPLADQRFHQRHHRALAQVIGVGLERQADHAHLLLACLQHGVHTAIDLSLVGRHHRAQQRRRDVVDAARAQERANILRQARPAVCKARFQVRRRDVQLAVLPEDAHHVLRVGAERIAQIRNLVSERDFQGVKRVADVLHHLCGAHARLEKRRRHAAVELPQLRRRVGVVAAHQHKRRMVEVLERRAFTHELGIHRNAQLGHAAAGAFRQHPRQHPLGGAGQHRAAQHDRERVHTRLACGADGRRHARQPVIVGLAMAKVGRAHADQRHVRGRNALDGGLGGREAPLPDHARQDIAKAWLDDGRLARIHHRHFVGIEIDADDMVPVARQTGSRDAADIAESKNTDIHHILRRDIGDFEIGD